MIGGTPLLELADFAKRHSLSAKIFAKIEKANPAGSAKDRAALYMINEAESCGALKAGGTVIEPTSGNTGIALAAIAAARGYRVILTMPDSMSLERRKLLAAYGAQIVLTAGADGMKGAIAAANELKEKIEGSIIAGQFENAANPRAHYETTAPEIYSDLDGQIDLFTATVGTGGTLCGCARFFKEKCPQIKVFAAEPSASPLLSGGVAGPHKIQGIGANFIPEIIDPNLYDGVITVGDSEAMAYARELAKKDGLLVGISSGAALASALKLAKMPENTGKNIVTVFPDTGERYLSSELFE